MDLLRFVFVTNDDRGLGCLKRRSIEPRENSLFLSDMTDKDAIDFVETACKDKLEKYDMKEVKQVIKEITGGRVIALAQLVVAINNGQSLNGKCYNYHYASIN